MFRKDTFRLIKRTHKRFLSLFLIVTIGVAFMVGVMASSPVLRDSVDLYYDENHLMDIQLYSSYGFCKEDISAIKKVNGVKDVFASKFVDVYGSDVNESVYVTRVQELNSNVNNFVLKEGRMPSKPNEALTLASSSFESRYKIGENVKLSLDEKDGIRNALKYQEYTIVGIVDTPQYMTLAGETSTLNNLQLDTVIYIDNDNFKSEYYTTVYLTIDGAEDLIAFTDEYNNYIDKAKIGLERVKNTQGNYLKDKLIKEVEEKIEDGERELNEKVQKANEEILKAQKELDDAHVEILVGESQLKSSEAQINSAKKEIAINEEILNKNASKLNAAIKEIENESGKSFEETYTQISASYQLYQILKIQQANGPESVKQMKEQIANNEKRIEELKIEKDNVQNLLDEELNKAIEDQDATKISELETQISDIDESIKNLEQANDSLRDLIKQIDGGSIQDTMDKLDESCNGSVEKTYEEINQVYQAKLKLDAGYEELNKAKKQIEDSQIQIDEAKKELNDGRIKYEDGLKELEDAKYELEIETEKAQNKLAKARQDLSELPDAEWTILSRKMHYSSYMYEGTIDQMQSIGLIFPLLFFLVAALVCMTTMTRLVDEERGQIGIFSALGFSKAKIISKYLTYALLASVCGSAIGLVIGMSLFPTVIYSTWRLMYNLPAINLHLPIDIALLGVLSFTVLMLAVTYMVVRNSLKEVPAQLLRPKAPKNASKVFLEKIGPIWSRLSFTSKITARNLIRYKSRFFMTIIGVAGCTGLLVAGFGIKDSISDIINIQYKEVFDYTNTISLEDDRNIDDILNLLYADSNNEQVVPFLEYASKVYFNEEKTISVHVYDDRQIDRVMNLRTLKDKQELNIHGNGVVISEKYAKVNGIEVGDEIQIESKDGIKANVLVDGICELYFQHYLFMSKELYEESFNETLHYNSIAVKAIDSSYLEQELQGVEGINNIIDFTPMIDNFQNMIDALDFIILVIIISSGSLAFVVLFNLTEINISERIREIATIKVLGFNDHEVNSYIFKEIILLTVLGALVGLPLGKVEHNLIMTVIDMEMVMFGMNISFMSYLYAFLITIVFTALVLFSMSKVLKKVKMVESLKSVE